MLSIYNLSFAYTKDFPLMKKLNFDVLKNKIENLYKELDLNTKNLEQESKHFTQFINKLQR